MDAISDRGLKQISWSTIVMFALGFWLSGSLLLDSVIIPSLSAAGMMASAGFANAGYLIFGVFNRIELLCAAAVLTSFLVLRRQNNFSPWTIVLGGLLLAITLVYTYILTPQMSGLGLQLNLFDESLTNMPQEMIYMHWGYWSLEAIKFIAGVTLLRWCYRNSCTI
ncbi:MAG: DUF4149 domain-containing protein [Prochloron sp. SP5CPC1]|nr:DUF4149 domain-containing protein [Candidatus Paraprochloron terpiosi SP5CPC1]